MKRILLSLIILGGAFSMVAAPISPEDALSKAMQSLSQYSTRSLPRYELVKTEKYNGKAAVYVFGSQKEEGFIITPAVDNCVPVLGYGDSNIFDENGETAPGFAYWISELGRQIEYASNAKTNSNTVKISRPERDPIPVLCTTQWNQGAPYNDNCPVVRNQTCVTGCVATAMSQVMKYHNWPEIGEGNVSYKGPGSKTLKMNYARTIFKWDDMLDTYNSSSSKEACEAVATLMEATGYSVSMSYSPDGSGASSMDIAPALGKYFKYDKSLRYLMRDYYSLNEWEEIIYNSLKKYGPVIYNGQATVGGHSFVCDGYSSDGYFHFNWGWGGLSDGYFILDALDPMSQGIGGADGGFDYLQDVIVDIRPDTAGNSSWSFQMYGSDSPEYTIEQDVDGQYLALNSGFFNYGPGPIKDAYVGFIYTDIDNPKKEPVYELYFADTIDPLYGFGGIESDILSLDDGRYEVELVYGTGEEDPLPVKFPIYVSGKTIITVKGGNYSVENEIVEAPDFLNPVYPDQVNIRTGILNIRGTLSNPNSSPYLCFLGAVVLDNSLTGILSYTTPTPYDLDGNESIDINYDTTLASASSISTGYHYFAIAEINLMIGRANLLCEPERIYFASFSGIEAMFGDETGRMEFYTLDGIKVAETDGSGNPNLPSGLYIVKTAKGSSKVYLK